MGFMNINGWEITRQLRVSRWSAEKGDATIIADTLDELLIKIDQWDRPEACAQ